MKIIRAKKYVLVGLGGRSVIFKEAFARQFADRAKLVAIFDSNLGRLAYTAKELEPLIPDLKSFSADDFDKMLAELKPDVVIVCTKDCDHSEYICRAMDAGCDVIAEKPMVTDEKQCRDIINKVNETGKNVRVTFNYRYAPVRSQIKELLMDGVIGKVLSVDFRYLLDTTHGADYFRRWHRHKSDSGGLMVHKATHHFDLLNWWLGCTPEIVAAQGSRIFYTEKQAEHYGLKAHGQRCLTCPVHDKCNFYLDMNAYDSIRELYLENEHYDGYYRDMCIFGNDIDIEDSMNVTVKYRDGAFLSYNLCAFSPYKGYSISLKGTKGRIDHFCRETSYVNGDESIPEELNMGVVKINIFPHFKTPYSIEAKCGEGEHDGGDAVMLEDLFGDPGPDPLKRAADYNQGLYSVLVGIAANKSMATNTFVKIDDLVPNLPEPDFAPMPGEDETIEYVSNVKRFRRNIEVAETNLPTKLT